MLDVSVSVSSGGTVSIRVAGEVDALSAPVLRQAVDAACAAGCRRVVVDLRGVTFLNVPGLRALAHARAVAAERGTVLTLATSPGHVSRLLQLVGLDGAPGRPDGKAVRPRPLADPVAHARKRIERLVPEPRR